MRMRIGIVCLLGLMAVGAAAAWAQEPRSTPLEGKAASIEYRGEGEPDTFQPGAVLFTNRTYTVAECPESLKEKRFLRGSIDSGYFRVTAAGILTLLTPEPVHPRAATQAKTLEARGFVRIAPPERFQLFGEQPFDLVWAYQKQVQPGEKSRWGKWVVAVGFEAAAPWAPTDTPWSKNRGERLYNGIVLPQEWPPQEIDPRSTEPMPVPYLNSRPAVVPINVGRQLFVDNFLVENTDLKRVFHLPVKYAGNPVLKPETELEINAPRNAAAVPKSGGVWWDSATQIFKMWYEAGWIHTICYATSKDGLTWERPTLDVNPGTNQVLPSDLTPDSWTVVPDGAAQDPQQKYKLFLRPPGGQMPGWSMTSPDGIHWTNRTPTRETGDRSTMFYNPFRKKWIYYTGFRGDAKKLSHNWLQNGMYDRGATGVALLRRDGFASPDAGDEPATLTTRPVTFSGRRVFVNAATAAGELRVAILDEAGQPIAPFTAEACRPMRADSTLEPVTWSGAEDVSALRGKPVRFRFTLRNGSLYAFWVSRDDTGRSDGYVAGGGPGFTELIDTAGRAALDAERRLDVNKTHPSVSP